MEADRPEGSGTRRRERDLARYGVAGSHGRWSVDEIREAVGALVAADPRQLLGLGPFYGATTTDVIAALAETWGWPHQRVMASINPERTLERFHALLESIDEVAAAGGRIAFATARPASLLGVYRSLVDRAAAAGASVPEEHDTNDFIADGRRGRRLRWLHGVAVVTDGSALLPTGGVEAGSEWAFRVGRADLWVGDMGFAAAALADGGRIAAFVDFEAVAVAVAASRVPPSQAVVVPLDDQRPPLAYEVLTDLVSTQSDH